MPRSATPVVLLLLALLLSTAGGAAPGPADTLYQFSTLDALLAGVYDGPLTFEELALQGDFGLGTCQHLDGEMVALDGVFYQVTSDGVVHEVPPEEQTPFACVTFFSADQELAVESAVDIEELEQYVDAQLTSCNYFCAVRVEGDFTDMRVRSVPEQQEPYPPLTEVVKEQSVFPCEAVTGTLVGLRSPGFVKGLNAPGYHFHFLSADRSYGGHVLSATLQTGTIAIDVTPDWLLELPEEETFANLDLSVDTSAATHAVEKETSTDSN
jgi:acetolactate decarboxylase